MPTAELQLLSRIIRGGRPEYAVVVEWGITHDDFLTQEGRGLWNHIAGFQTLTGSRSSVPGIHAMEAEYPHIKLCDDESMSTELLCLNVRNVRLIQAIKKSALETIENVEMGPMDAANYMQQQMSRIIELGTSKNTDVHFASAYDEIMGDIAMGENGVNTARAAWPWQSLQAATGGIQEDDYVVFYGRPKSMKSWVLCYILGNLFLQDKRVIFYTKEMTPKNIYKRIAACLAEVPYQEMRNSRLEPVDKSKLVELHRHIEDLGKRDTLVCLSGRDVPYGGDTVSWFRAKADKYKPHVAAIDGMYLMSSGGGPKQADHLRVMSISREVSAMRLDLGLPVIATMQANRKAAGHSNAELDEVAYSDAVGQDATIACRVINEKGKPTIALVVGGSREFQLHGLRIGGVPATDFREKELLTEKDINKAKENDVSEGEAESDAASHAKPRRTPKTNGMSETQQIEKMLDAQLKNI